ncbi:hypothetical protein MLD38_010721 [Melastoma candidum]|uniref:Uncharacterized protein n=1 Tax=Melastoma candidum TaxID=119954 RepID=A0ACB9R4A0_9MYRT|nr:hypothetical protein MLD38_010721 [Melastoma candidum]
MARRGSFGRFQERLVSPSPIQNDFVKRRACKGDVPVRREWVVAELKSEDIRGVGGWFAEVESLKVEADSGCVGPGSGMLKESHVATGMIGEPSGSGSAVAHDGGAVVVGLRGAKGRLICRGRTRLLWFPGSTRMTRRRIRAGEKKEGAWHRCQIRVGCRPGDGIAVVGERRREGIRRGCSGLEGREVGSPEKGGAATVLLGDTGGRSIRRCQEDAGVRWGLSSLIAAAVVGERREVGSPELKAWPFLWVSVRVAGEVPECVLRASGGVGADVGCCCRGSPLIGGRRAAGTEMEPPPLLGDAGAEMGSRLGAVDMPGPRRLCRRRGARTPGGVDNRYERHRGFCHRQGTSERGGDAEAADRGRFAIAREDGRDLRKFGRDGSPSPSSLVQARRHGGRCRF